ncbi:MAG: hypothetical protein K0A90_00150 [Methanosarcinaceae archaeon]|nr:hypothetical protein [Methanosarcinaceae archaeon]
MAFTYTITGQTYFGDKKIVTGTYTSSAGGTGGDILTGLTNCTGCILQGTGSAVDLNEPVINETFPVAGGAITIVTTADKSGVFVAMGY